MLRWGIRLTGLSEIPYDAAVEVNHKVYCFRGDFIESQRRTEVHVFNTVSLCWTRLPPETPGRGQRLLGVHPMRTSRTAVLIDPFIYIWGGVTDTRNYWNYSKVLYAFDVNAHKMLTPRVSGTAPEGRRGHSACVFENVMFIYGGENRPTEYNNDIYKLDTTTMVWSLINTRGTPPPASYQHSATIVGTKMYVFGGLGYEGHYNTFSVFDTETNCWLNTPSAQLCPEGHSDHSAFTYNGELYIFGGSNFKDLWKFSPATFTWKKVESKGNVPWLRTYSNKLWGCMVCCFMVGDRIILFRGHKSYKKANDNMYILYLSPSLKTLCKLAVIQYGLEQSGLPHNIRWELAAMTTNSQ